MILLISSIDSEFLLLTKSLIFNNSLDIPSILTIPSARLFNSSTILIISLACSLIPSVIFSIPLFISPADSDILSISILHSLFFSLVSLTISLRLFINILCFSLIVLKLLIKSPISLLEVFLITPLKLPSDSSAASFCNLFIGLTIKVKPKYPIIIVIITETTKILIEVFKRILILFKCWLSGIAITYIQSIPSIVL